MVGKNNSQQQTDYNFASINKGLILLGVILLVIYFVFIISGSTVSDQHIWEDSYSGSVGPLSWVLPIGLLLITIPLILYFFHIQFVKLSEFAEEVESGEFEKRILIELEEEDNKIRIHKKFYNKNR
jgi:hypothetical protein